jgi:hypothetical protein
MSASQREREFERLLIELYIVGGRLALTEDMGPMIIIDDPAAHDELIGQLEAHVPEAKDYLLRLFRNPPLIPLQELAQRVPRSAERAKR